MGNLRRNSLVRQKLKEKNLEMNLVMKKAEVVNIIENLALLIIMNERTAVHQVGS